MMMRLVLGAAIALLAFADTMEAAVVLRVAIVSPQSAAGNVLVGVFALPDANVLIGGYDMPVNFGAVGPTALPTGITYLGATNTIFTSGSTLTSTADNQNLVDFIVSDATTVAPPFPQLTSGIEAKLFDLRFNVGPTAVEGSTFTIAVSGTHPFFNLNDNSAAAIRASSFTAGSLTISAVPEPSSLLLLALAAFFAVSRRQGKLRASLSSC